LEAWIVFSIRLGGNDNLKYGVHHLLKKVRIFCEDGSSELADGVEKIQSHFFKAVGH
jgi:hypothetical protein